MASIALNSPNAVLKAALVGGFAAGGIDIAYAILANLAKGVSGARVLQSVASGLLGRGAYDGGPATAVFGLLLHFFMTIVMALLFIAAARGLAPIRENLIIAGLAYGAAIFFAMRWVVVPMSRFPGDLRTITPLELVVHMIGVGLVIALIARRLGAVPATSL